VRTESYDKEQRKSINNSLPKLMNLKNVPEGLCNFSH